ncbi:glycoside hydrolase family 17 protein [Azospirillum canadense]|uniref:glycoside hydrolase family 17 protein n=1 Tax=Azospirillum canadense TaxID=403962 RepID=UPI0022279926|nr:glycosyl hydrolase family 17 protein [Azospirillum canadense]MCW2235445.1 exo-beta-1,3-glucanase (GH17 family) [Azospirillum canadense]
MRIIKLLAVLVLAGLANFAVWSLSNQPVPLDPPPGGKLKSVSFAPFRDGQSPLTHVFPTTEQIDEDLAALAPQVAGVRTYTSLEGLEVVPELARKHGMTVTMGAWLSSKLDKNEAEVASLIDLANRYPDVITRVIVGNEVLLRRELTAEQVAGYIDRVKAAVKQPVSYADVWEWWLKYPLIADHVDYLTIHLLPYWEDVPTDVAGAQERIRSSYRTIAQRFPGKPILVGETGWPTAGRSRGAAVTGLVNKAKFVNGFVRLAQQEGFDYNVIEAFDQGWKAKLEGTVGGHWGLYTADREAKFSLAGPVVENKRWPLLFGISTALAVVLVAGLGARGRTLTLGAYAAFAFLAQALSGLYVHAVYAAMHGKHYWQDVTLAGGMLALTGLLSLTVLLAVRRTLNSGELALEPLASLRGRPTLTRTEWLGRATTLALTAAALVWSFLIVFDGRYRDFPNPYFALPALGLLALGATRTVRRPPGTGGLTAWGIGALFRPAVPVADIPARSLCAAVRRMPVEAALAGLLVLGAVLTVIAEGFVPLESLIYGQLPFLEALHEVDWAQPNLEALAWAGLQLLLAIPYGAAVLSARVREPARAGQWVRVAGE